MVKEGTEMKKKFEEPLLDITKFQLTDIIATSGAQESNEDEIDMPEFDMDE